jgi:hypothetical protein
MGKDLSVSTKSPNRLCDKPISYPAGSEGRGGGGGCRWSDVTHNTYRSLVCRQESVQTYRPSPHVLMAWYLVKQMVNFTLHFKSVGHMQ